MSRRAPRSAVAALAFAAAGLTACAPGAEPAALVRIVDTGGRAFAEPAALEVASGTTVRWHNTGSRSWTVLPVDETGEASAADAFRVAPGETVAIDLEVGEHRFLIGDGAGDATSATIEVGSP
jgi:plastocyanin